MTYNIGFDVRLYVDGKYKPNFTDYVTIEFDGFDGKGVPSGGSIIETSPYVIRRSDITGGNYPYFMITIGDDYLFEGTHLPILKRPTKTSTLYRQNATQMGAWQSDGWPEADAWDENNPTTLEIRVREEPLPKREVTATKPSQSGNTLKIPNVAGVIYYDMLTGFEVFGEQIITQTMLIGVMPDPQSTTYEYVIVNSGDMWTFMVKKIINVPDPEDHTSYIMIPDIDNVEFFDGKDGKIIGPGKYLVGSRLEVRVRPLDEEKYSLVHNGPWVYTRTGGVTALSPELRGPNHAATIPSHSEVEYYAVHSGKVLPPGPVDSDYYESTGYLTIAPRAKGGAFLNNPNDRWLAGMFRYGFKINSSLRTLSDENIDLGENFNEYFNVYLNGRLVTEYEYAPPLPVGTVEIIVELKKADPLQSRRPFDFYRGSQGEPIYVTSPDGEFEWISGDRLKYVGNWPWTGKPRYKRITISLREVETLEVVPLNLWTTADITYPARNLETGTGKQYDSGFTIPGDQITEFFDITMDGKELDWRYPETRWGFTAEQRNRMAEAQISTGYHEFKVSIKNPDFVFEQDEYNRRISYIGYSGAKWTLTEEGDLVWKGTIENLREGLSMKFHIRTYVPSGTINITNPGRKYDLVLDREKNAVYIPEWPYVQYYDINENRIIPPGWLDITRFIAIGIYVRDRIEKKDGRYVKHRYDPSSGENYMWKFGVVNIKFEATAKKPTQNGYLLYIPYDEDVIYYDIIEGALVSGVIDLRYRSYEKSLIRPFPRHFDSYVLTNEGIEWEFFNSNLVYPVKPTREGYIITIPEVLGVYYRVRDNDGIDKKLSPGDTHRITSDTKVIAFAEDDFEIGEMDNLENVHEENGITRVEWDYTFEEEERRQVVPIPPTVDGNWVIIPITEGVIYVNKETGERVRGNLYVTEDTTILAIPEDESKIELIGETIEWLVVYEDTSDKEITIPVLDPRVVVKVNGEVISGNSFSVPIKEYVSIILTIKEGAKFQNIPFLSNNLGYERDFFLNKEGTVASMSVEFLNNDAVNLHIGVIDIPTKTLTFRGENTYLTAYKSGGQAITLRPGETTELELHQSYSFSIRPNLGHDLDVIPSMTHGTHTTRATDANRGYAAFDLLYIQYNVTISAYAYPTIDPDPVDPGPGPVDPVDPVDPTYPVDPDDPIDPGVPVGVTGFNNIYMVNKRTLSEISREMLVRKRQFMISGGKGGLNHDSQLITDPHTYIINTIQLPFKVSQEAVLDRQRITLGYTSLAPSAQRLKTDKLKVSLGNIYVTPKYNNAYDYKNTDIILHLPYSGPVHLDPNYVLDEELSIEYLVDAYTGHTTINIRSSFVNNNVFHSKETYIGNEIPFISMKDGSVVGSTSESRSLVNNNVMTPYIEVIRNIPYEMDSDFNKDTTLTVDNLQDVTGRIYVHNISLNVNTTLTEENTIKSILAGGITIK